MAYGLDVANAGTSMPAPGTQGTYGYPTAGSPPGTNAPVIDPYYIAALQEEICNVVRALGGTPTKASVNQMATLLAAAYGVTGMTQETNASGQTSVAASITFTPAISGNLRIQAVALNNAAISGIGITASNTTTRFVYSTIETANGQYYTSNVDPGDSLSIYGTSGQVARLDAILNTTAGSPVTITVTMACTSSATQIVVLSAKLNPVANAAL